MNTNTNTKKKKKSCSIVLVPGPQNAVLCQTKTGTRWLHVHKQTKANTRYKVLTDLLLQILGFWDMALHRSV